MEVTMGGFHTGKYVVSAAQLDAMIANGTALLIDVREPDEFAAGHIAGARNHPLSTFNPAALPPAEGKRLVLQCAGGKRSAMALDRCAQAGTTVNTHLEGGLAAWQEAGLPVVRD